MPDVTKKTGIPQPVVFTSIVWCSAVGGVGLFDHGELIGAPCCMRTRATTPKVWHSVRDAGTLEPTLQPDKGTNTEEVSHDNEDHWKRAQLSKRPGRPPLRTQSPSIV